MDRRLYPQNWEAIAQEIKQSVNWICEGCGKPCRPPEIKLADVENWLKSNHPNWLSQLYEEVKHGDGTVKIQKPRRFSLSVAHLNHIPSDCRRENLKAFCNVCHCRYDLKQMAQKRYLKRERLGQLRLFDVN